MSNAPPTQSQLESIGYEDRYCAFVDVLGFSEIIAGIGRGDVDVWEIRNLLDKVHTRDNSASATADKTLRAQSISDGVCLSTAVTADGLRELLFSLEQLTTGLLAEGYFIRGGVVRGRIYHDKNMVFGDALVRAYRIESLIAKYPRIVIESDVAKEAIRIAHDQPDRTEYVKQASDGPYFLHVLRLIDVVLRGDKDDRLGLLSTYNGMAEMIQARLNAAVDRPRHYEKVHWFADYWNGVAFATHGRVPTIKGPGLGFTLGVLA